MCGKSLAETPVARTMKNSVSDIIRIILTITLVCITLTLNMSSARVHSNTKLSRSLTSKGV